MKQVSWYVIFILWKREKSNRESLSLSSSKISFLYICLTKWRYVMYLCRCILSPSSCQRVLRGILGGENIDSFMVLTNVYEQSINASRHAVVKFLSLWHVWRSDGKEMIAFNALEGKNPSLVKLWTWSLVIWK